MKNIIFVLVFLAGLADAKAQGLLKIGDLYELTVTVPNQQEAHDSANTFAYEVGNVLKATYPSKVLDPKVDLHVFMKDGQVVYRLTWSCRMVSASVTDADYYFDRRGTLLLGPTLDQAKRKVNSELKESNKVQVMRRAFKRSKIPAGFIKDSFSGSSAEGYWYIKEFFLVAPK